jgi:hypothetical protein
LAGGPWDVAGGGFAPTAVLITVRALPRRSSEARRSTSATTADDHRAQRRELESERDSRAGSPAGRNRFLWVRRLAAAGDTRGRRRWCDRQRLRKRGVGGAIRPRAASACASCAEHRRDDRPRHTLNSVAANAPWPPLTAGSVEPQSRCPSRRPAPATEGGTGWHSLFVPHGRRPPFAGR